MQKRRNVMGGQRGGRVGARRGTFRPRRRRPPVRIGSAAVVPHLNVPPELSVIIPARNEERTIGRVIRQAARIANKTEVIVVCNGSTDRTGRIAASLGAKVLTDPEPLGHDVGRSIGARAAEGDILLFIDGDFVVPAARLRPFVQAVRAGVDVALNTYSGPVRRRNVHSVVLAKHVLNTVCFRNDLQGASMTTVPHAISRNALKAIGFEQLSVPPKAMVTALQRGLTVKAVQFVPVGRYNPFRRKFRHTDPLESLIVGDHLEALQWWLEQYGLRGLRPDEIRMRDRVR